MTQTQKELLEVLESKHSNLYDFIANNYWLLDKDELKDLALEITCLLYVYASRNEPYDTEKANRVIHKELLENIKEYRPNLIGFDEE